MSFILEALKRSENERQRQAGPALAGVRSGGRRPRRSTWLTAVLTLLLVNLVVLTIVLLRPGDTSPDAGSTIAAADPPALAERRPSASVSSPPQPAAPIPERRTVSDLRSVSQAAGVRTPDAAGGADATRAVKRDQQAPRLVTPLSARASASTAPAGPVPADPEPAAPATETAALPTVQELTLRGEIVNLPTRLDLHVYYADPSRRLVFIGGRRYREGDRLESGPRVVEIVPDGVVLDDGIRLFLLPAR